MSPKVPTLKETETSLSYVQCSLYLVSSIMNVSIFHSTWLDTSWTDCIYHILFIILSENGIGVVSTYELLWTVLLLSFLNMFAVKHVNVFLLGRSGSDIVDI